jgi:hypothetical protein
MPATPEGFYEAVFRFQRVGGVRVSTWTLGIDGVGIGAGAPTTLADMLYGFGSDPGGPYAAGAMVGNWQFIGVTCTYMSPTGPIVGEHNETTTGAAVGAPLVPNCALLIKKTTASGGRRNRGRMYVPPVWPPETKVDGDGTIDSAEVATLQSQYDPFFDDLIGADLVPVLFHTESPFTPTPITGFQVQSLMATQRRRLRK